MPVRVRVHVCACLCVLVCVCPHIGLMQCSSRLIFDANQLQNYLTGFPGVYPPLPPVRLPPYPLCAFRFLSSHARSHVFCTKFMRFHFMKNFCNNFSKRFCGELKCEKNILRMATKNLRKTLVRTHTHTYTYTHTYNHAHTHDYNTLSHTHTLRKNKYFSKATTFFLFFAFYFL